MGQLSTFDHRSLHRNPIHEIIFAELAPFTWIEPANCYYVTDPDAVSAFFRHPRIEVVDYRSEYELLEDQVDEDFEGVKTYFDTIPFTLTGNAHQAAKRETLSIIKQRGPKASEQFEKSLRTACDAKLHPGSELDLMGDILCPSVAAFIRAINPEHSDIQSVATEIVVAFDPFVKVKRRIAANKLICAHMDVPPNSELADNDNRRKGLSTIAVDTLNGGIGYALHHAISENIGVRFSDVQWDDYKIKAAVVFVDRICTEDFDYNGHTFCKGEKLRLWLKSADGSDAHAGKLVFGGGKHICAGAKAALDLYDKVKQVLRGYNVSVESISLTEQKNAFLTVKPEKINLRLTQ